MSAISMVTGQTCVAVLLADALLVHSLMHFKLEKLVKCVPSILFPVLKDVQTSMCLHRLS